MKLHTIHRKHPDNQYGHAGLWFYLWPALGVTFACDHDLRTLGGSLEPTEELTAQEYEEHETNERLKGVRHYPRAIRTARDPEPTNYFYYLANGKVWKAELEHECAKGEVVIELTYEQYVRKYVELGQTDDDDVVC